MAIRLNKNPLNIHPIYSPRTSYKRIKEKDERMIADITLNFDKLTINMIKEEFQKRNNSLYLAQFIDIAKRNLKFWQVELPNRQTRLIRYLTYLFKEIDINANGDMEWEEFTNYIIEKATVLKNLKSKNQQIKHYIKSQITTKIRVENLIAKLEYCKDIDKIAYYQQTGNTIYFVNSQNGQLCSKYLNITPKKLIVNISSVKKQKTGKVSIRKKDLVLPTSVRVLDMLYLNDKKYKILLVSTSDGYVRGWKYTQNGVVLATQPDNQQQTFQHYFSTEIYCLSWDNINQILYCGQKSGGITMWNLKTDLERVLAEPRERLENEGQQKVDMLITSMINMPKLQFMASGRMDGKLILWDTINSKKKWVYKEHARGILSLAFNEAMILLFSAGFDHKICIWNPYISTIIHKIQGHLSPILSLKIIEGTNQLISMDSQGIVKVTDTRRFNIISSFFVQTEGGHGSNLGGSGVTSLIAINKPQKQILRLVFGGKHIWYYEYDKNYNPLTADENTVIVCRYVKQTLCFFTPAGNKVKVWSALNGDVQKIYMDITPFEITAFDFDFLRKRMIIGDSKGNIALYNTANGAKMKSLTHHAGEVIHLIATQHNESKSDIFISCGVDNQIRICLETEQSFEVVRTIYIKKEIEITCLKYSIQSRLVIVGTNAGSVSFFDVETGKCIGSFLQQITEEFTSISLISKSILVATSSTGSISLVGIPPFPFRFEKLISFKHNDTEKIKATVGVRLSCYYKKLNLLYIVDDKMYLTCYQLKGLEQIQKIDFGRQKNQFQRKSCIRDIINTIAIELKWQIKAHLETVKVLEFVEEEEILLTASFDKRVYIWNAITGQYIDSLQQNYNKNLPEPLAYFDIKKNYLFTKDRKKAFEVEHISNHELDFDPFLINSLKKHGEQQFDQSQSNKQWNVKIHFEDVVMKQKQEYQSLCKELQTFKLSYPQKHLEELRFSTKKIDILERKRKLMKSILNQHGQNNQTANKQETHQRKYSTTYFRKSMMKGIKSALGKSQSLELMQHLKNQKDKVFGKKKHFDYVPIFKTVNQNEKTLQEWQKHKQYVLELAKKQTQNIVNSRKNGLVVLSKEESDAANHLFTILKSTESRYTNKIPIKYVSKQNSLQNSRIAKHSQRNSHRNSRPPSSIFRVINLKKQRFPKFE